MNPEQLLQHFDRISEAPDAIPRLRRFILDMAVQGRLVEQDPNNEPAMDLFKRIRAEKSRMVSAGEIRKQQPLSALNTDEIPFELPELWDWQRLGETGLTQTGTTPSSNNPEYFGDFIPFVKPANLTGNCIDYSGEGISEKGIQYSRLIPKQSVLMVCIGSSIGKVNVTERDVCCNQQINTVTPFIDQLTGFISIALKATYFQKLVLANAGMGTLPIISKGKWEVLPVPVPPLAEQKRIVAKVDELMALCDELQVAQSEREQSRDRLVAASLHSLNPPTDDETANVPKIQREHARFLFNHLPRLTTRPAHIKQLRQTILNLAVRGKLVPQDLNDDPASELLEQIQAEKARLVKAGNIRKQPAQAKIRSNELPFILPSNWAWSRLGDIIHLVSGQHLQPGEYSNDDRSGLPYITGPADFGANGLEITRYAVAKKAIATKGQILLTVKGSGVGKTAICDLPEVAISRQLMAMTAIAWSQKFLLLVTHRLAETLKENARSLIPGIAREDVDHFVFALPPLAEQHRIVAKVDELMALCDQLETQLADTAADSRRLLEAVLHETLSPASEQAA